MLDQSPSGLLSSLSFPSAFSFHGTFPSSPKSPKSSEKNKNKISLLLSVHLLETYARCNPNFFYDTTLNPRRILTRPCEPFYNDGFDNKNFDLILKVNDSLMQFNRNPEKTPKHEYLIVDLLGKGVFGQVVKCIQVSTSRQFAIKVIKSQPAYSLQGRLEIEILRILNIYESKWKDGGGLRKEGKKKENKEIKKEKENEEVSINGTRKVKEEDDGGGERQGIENKKEGEGEGRGEGGGEGGGGEGRGKEIKNLEEKEKRERKKRKKEEKLGGGGEEDGSGEEERVERKKKDENGDDVGNEGHKSKVGRLSGKKEGERIVRLYDAFCYHRHLCLVFELLDISLFDLIRIGDYQGFFLSDIKYFAKQLLEGLLIAEKCGVIHCDLKPENILFVNSKISNDIKIIDFGSACMSNKTTYTYIQSRFYRAPEVLLGLPYESAIDLWSFGCILAELYLGVPIFPGNSQYDQLRRIIEVLGPLPKELLEGRETYRFFKMQEGGGVRLKTMEEYMKDENCVLDQPKQFFKISNLFDLKKYYEVSKFRCSEQGKREQALLPHFLDFLSLLLQYPPSLRPPSSQLLLHSFISLTFLPPITLSSSSLLLPHSSFDNLIKTLNFNDIEGKKEGDKEGRNDKVGQEIEEGGDKDKGGGEHNEKGSPERSEGLRQVLKIDEEKGKEEEKRARYEGNLEEWLGVGTEGGMRERVEGGQKVLLEGWFRRGSEEKSRFFKG